MKNKLLALFACVLALFAAAAPASAHCGLTGVGGVCLLYIPDPPAGWSYCANAGNPAANEVQLFQFINYQGYCFSTSLANAQILNVQAQDFSVGSIKSRKASDIFVQSVKVYSGTNLTGSSWTVPYGDTPVIGQGAGNEAWCHSVRIWHY